MLIRSLVVAILAVLLAVPANDAFAEKNKVAERPEQRQHAIEASGSRQRVQPAGGATRPARQPVEPGQSQIIPDEALN